MCHNSCVLHHYKLKLKGTLDFMVDNTVNWVLGPQLLQDKKYSVSRKKNRSKRFRYICTKLG